MNARKLHTLFFATAMILSLVSCGGGGSGNSTSVTCGKPGSRCVSQASGLAYILYTPSNFHSGSSALVMALHPLHGTGDEMENITGLDAKADQEGFAVLYPSSPSRQMWCWYGLTCNDVPALRTMIETVQATLHADPKKIYAFGVSDGALMANRVGVELSDVVAAIAPVSGFLYDQFSYSPPVVIPQAAAPVSVLIIQNDIPPDQGAYVCGFTNSATFETKPSTDIAFNYWTGSQANDCATVSTSAPICTTGGLQLTEKHATDCKGTTQVKFYEWLNGYHAWYGIPGNWNVPVNTTAPCTAGTLYASLPCNSNYDATMGATTNDIIWNFFAAHPKP